jgi:hypothetical protein
MAALRPLVASLDHRRVLTTTPHAVRAGGTLRHHRHEVNRGDDGRLGIGGLPEGDGLVEHAEHLLLGIFAEDAHLLRVWIAVVGDDPVLREQRAWLRGGTGGPFRRRLRAIADSGAKAARIHLAAPRNEVRRDGIRRRHFSGALCGNRAGGDAADR